jgi:hypothetical protein
MCSIFLISLVYFISVWVLAIVIWKSHQKIVSALCDIKNAILSTSFVYDGGNATKQTPKVKKQLINDYENQLEESLTQMDGKIFDRSVDVSEVSSQESSSHDDIGDLTKALKGMQ